VFIGKGFVETNFLYSYQSEIHCDFNHLARKKSNFIDDFLVTIELNSANLVNTGIIRFKSRVVKTLRGSSDDIGWLQHAPGMPQVQDGTSRFLELLSGMRYPI